ncbi:MAG: transglycosylase SLT domain-containing protein [Bacteroidales bacterium]|nr:transglycosylase SLT domain-containing protein [Bacteroidales bacterium]
MMRFTEKHNRRLRNVLVTLTVICLTPLCERGRMLKGADPADAFAGSDITCVIDLGDEMYGKHGLETGMTYELLNRFAQDSRCNVEIRTARKGDNYLDSLRTGKVDIVIAHVEDLDDTEGVQLSRMLNSCSAWAVSSKEESRLRQINIWISHIAESEEYNNIYSRYSAVYDPHKKAERGIITNTISPYDDLLRKYAAELGWDWRMLAAVVYQESRFSINSRSSRGAQGLMQVMPKTAEYYGICDLLNPETNLKAGISHLKRLQKMFHSEDFEPMERIKFTLAAYNAGEGRIADCRNLAAAKQVDTTRWDEIVKIIPLMRDESILEEDSVRLGMFQGHETIEYVDSIMSLYNSFCSICPSI